jgi:ribosomal protein S1
MFYDFFATKTYFINKIISGSVKAREDHGYTIDSGIGDLTGFFKTDKNSTPTVRLSLGQTCLFKIQTKTSKRALNLKLCTQSESLFYDLKTRNQFDTYLPGAHLNQCTVEKISKNGLQLALPNQLFAFVHVNHIPSGKRAQKLNQTYNIGDKLNGTIIFINPYSKIIYLSLLSHLNDSTKPSKLSQLLSNSGSEGLRLGQVVEDAQVSMHTFKGIYIKFKTNSDEADSSKQVVGFIPKRHLKDSTDQSDDEEEDENDGEVSDKGEKLKKIKRDAKNMELEDIEKLYPLNSKLRARIYDFNLIEDMILLSCRESVLKAEYMSYDELQVGQIVKCKVKGINTKNGGVSVDLGGEFLHGFIPKIHTSDIPLSETLLPKKMKLQSEIKCKIVQLNTAEKRCILTAKKTLIKSKLKLIDSFDDGSIEHGMETYGVVIAIKEFGLLLGFMNDIKGLLPRQEISKSLSKDQNLNELYYLGQLLKCRVKYFNNEKQALKLSLLMDDQENGEKKQNDYVNKFETYESGDLVESVTILQVNEENQYFKVKLPNGNKMGILYKNHLSDLYSINDFLFEYYKRQMKITQNLMIIHDSSQNKDNNNNNKKAGANYYLTMKKTLIDFYSSNGKSLLPKTLFDLSMNKWYPGWIRNVINNGVLVEMPSNLAGYCSKIKINYIEQDLNLDVGQSILFKINKLFENDPKKRFLTSLKTRFDLNPKNLDDQKFMLAYFESYLTSLRLVYDLFDRNKENKPSNKLNTSFTEGLLDKVRANELKVGSVVQCVVKSFNRASGQIECLIMKNLDDLNQIDLNADLNLTGIAYANPDEIHDSAYRQGTKLDAFLLAYDPLTQTFCLSIDKKAQKVYRKNFDDSFQKQTVCKQDQSIKGEILFVGQWFAIVGLKAHALGRLALMPLFKNDFTQLNRYMALHSDTQIKKIDQTDLKIRQKQVLSVSSASLSSLSFNALTDDLSDKLKSETSKNKAIKKEDKRFSYFYVGQSLNVIVKSLEHDYMIVFNDLNRVKRNKKMLLRQLAILNENHKNGDDLTSSTSLKRKRSSQNDEEDDVIVVKKKLVLNGDKNSKKKRNLSESSQTNENEDKDFIEIVTDVKKVKTTPVEAKKTIADDAQFMFPWEVTDFDQFYSIVNKVDESTGENKNDQNEKANAGKKKTKLAQKIDDRIIFEVSEKFSHFDFKLKLKNKKFFYK